MNITPFSTFNSNYQKPFSHFYETPVYDPTDLVGDFDDDGNPIGDGTPDNPGKILYYQKNYSGTNKDSFAIGTGITLNFSIPLDRGFQNQCKSAADTQISIQKQVTIFHSVCSDVFLTPKPNQIEKHYHSFSIPEKK